MTSPTPATEAERIACLKTLLAGQEGIVAWFRFNDAGGGYCLEVRNEAETGKAVVLVAELLKSCDWIIGRAALRFGIPEERIREEVQKYISESAAKAAGGRLNRLMDDDEPTAPPDAPSDPAQP